MHNTRATKKAGIVIVPPTFAESFAKVRKTPVPQGTAFRDKRNDYRRKPKHFSGW